MGFLSALLKHKELSVGRPFSGAWQILHCSDGLRSAVVAYPMPHTGLFPAMCISFPSWRK